MQESKKVFTMKVKDNKQKIEFPEFDIKNESINQYMERFRQYQIKMIEDKYNIIFEFVKEWLSMYDIEIKCLTDFKKISSEKINNKKINRKILKKYKTSICKELKILEDDGDIEEESIITFLKRALEKINYSLKYTRIIKQDNSSEEPDSDSEKCIKVYTIVKNKLVY
jgi:hypothetical protein